MGAFKRMLRSLWGVTEPETSLTPAIDCEACRIARSAGKDACNDHRTHHDRHHPPDADPEPYRTN